MTTTRRRLFVIVLSLALGLASSSSFAQDRDAAWTALLVAHVVKIDGGHASQVDYAGFAADRVALDRYTGALSAVSKSAFDGLSKPQQMAFLINAYNAFTIELILTRYPKLDSIRDLGSVFSSPWKQRFITLLGDQVSLDDIEHGMLRAPGRYDDPRIHFAVNCASIGCPALREEAYVAERLEAQLDDQVRRFLSDRTRNRFDPKTRALQVSKLFDWYGADFTKGHRGITSIRGFLAGYADQLADAPGDRATIRGQGAPVGFTDYDWRLNDVPHGSPR
ncbi:MAG: DUF547 domain-containing protein [Burkholderiaceae bacterium]